MRALVINSMFYTPAYRRCVDELGALDDIDLTVLTVDGWIMNDRLSKTAPLAADAPYSMVVGNAFWKGKENRGFYTSGLRRAFQRSRPDIIFLMEEPFSLFALQVLFFRALLSPNTPIVFFTWNNLSYRQFDYRPSLWYRMVSRFSLDRFAGALTANNDGIEVLRKEGFQQPIERIGYGVATERFLDRDEERVRTIRAQFPPTVKIVGYVGRILWMKGLNLLLEAVAALKREDVRLLIVGSGEYETEFHALVAKLGISDKIIHLPSVDHADVPAYMQAMDILVLPSRRVGMWAEQFGRVVIEAMAASTIVIGSDSGAIAEVIGDAGFIFPENDANALRGELEKALDLSEEARARMINRGRERAEKVFTWRKFAEQAKAFLESIHLRH